MERFGTGKRVLGVGACLAEQPRGDPWSLGWLTFIVFIF